MYVLWGLYFFAGGHDHHEAVEEDGHDDDKGEQRMHHDMNCHPEIRKIYIIYEFSTWII